MTRRVVPQRYALLAREPRGWLLRQAILNSERHQLREFLPTERDVPADEIWKLLIEQSDVEAVLVDADDPQTLAAARELAIRGKPLIVREHPTLPPEFVSELSLYATEGSTSVIPWFDHRHGLDGHEQFDDLRRWIESSAVGQVTSIHIDRELSGDAEFRTSVLLTGTLLTDIDTLRMIGGDYSQVTLIRTGGGVDFFSSQTLQLAGPGRPDATCTYRRTETPSGLRLRIEGTESSAEVVAEDDDLVWRVGGIEVDRSRPPEFDDSVRAAEQQRILARLDALWTRPEEGPSWIDLARIFEIGEAAQRSLRRRRTIELHFETTSERSEFKSHMAAIGCGVILWTMLGVIGLLFAGAVLDPRDRMQREAEASGFVFETADFEQGTDRLTQAGALRLKKVAGSIAMSESVAIIAVRDPGAPSPLDEARLQSVRDGLAALGVQNVQARTVLRPLAGAWFTRVLQIARVLVFAPVGLYLIVQVLLIVAKPAANQTESA